MQNQPLNLDVHEQIEVRAHAGIALLRDPSILEIEKSKIFRRTWQLVGTLHQTCGK